MSRILKYLAAIIIALVAFFIAEIICGDSFISGERQPAQAINPWQKIDTPIDTPVFDPKGTTAWPELGQKRPNKVKSTTPSGLRDFVAVPKTNLNPTNPVQSQINFFENERNSAGHRNPPVNNPIKDLNVGVPMMPPRRDFVNNQNANKGQNIANTPNNQNGQSTNLGLLPVAPPRRDFVNNQNANKGQNIANSGGINVPNNQNGQGTNLAQVPVTPPRRDFVNNQNANKGQNIANGAGINVPNNQNGQGINLAQTPVTPPRRDFVNNQNANKGQNIANTGGINVPNNQNGPGTNLAQTPVAPPRRDFVNNPKPNIGKNNENSGATNGGVSLTQIGIRPSQPNQNVDPSRRDFVNTPKPNIAAPTWVRPTPSTNTPNFVSSPKTPQPTQKPVLNYAQVAQKNPTSAGVNPNPSKIPLSAGPPGPQVDTNNYQSKPDLNADVELREFSEALIKKDVNNAAKYVTINYQGKTRSGSLNDEAPQPLLSINSEAFKIPSIEKLILLHNNYILESVQNEVYTAQEKIEENTLLDLILSTPVMQYTRNFLIQKGKLSKDPKDFRDLLKTIWFNMYSRGGGKIGSSGFEHVFLAEIKNDAISGLHNWIYFHDEENKKMANYLGYMKKLEFEKGAIIKYHFNFHNKDKPVGSMFIGTSPEFEMALYSTCFIMRPNQACPLRLGGNNFVVRTFTYKYRGKEMIGSAFPEI